MKRYDLEADESGGDGWFGGRPPGIKSVQWPRSRNTGLPMVHLVTLRLPPEYRRRGDAYPGIAVFQAHDVEASEVEGVSDLLEGQASLSKDQKSDAFFVAIAKYAKEKHPMERVWTEPDIGFALLWLTAEELAGKPAKLPKEIRHEDVEEEPAAWDSEAERARIRLREIEDPNAGKRPREMTAEELASDGRPGVDEPTGDYVPYFRLSERLQEQVGYAKHHLGGTLTHPGNLDLPDGITPYVLELNEVDGANFAGGGLVLDLESQTLLWAAG